MSSFLYYLLTFAESVTSVFGLRFPYEQPHYAVIQDLGQSVEVRHYGPRLAIEAIIKGTDRDKSAGAAFTLLFHYITGANQRDQKITMTVPVRTESERIAMTAPVQTAALNGQLSMRFFLPHAVAEAGRRRLWTRACGHAGGTRPSGGHPARGVGWIVVEPGRGRIPA